MPKNSSNRKALRLPVTYRTIYSVKNNGQRAVSGFLDCGEARDTASLKLPGNQMEFIKALKAQGKPIIALVIGGRPYEITELSELADGIIAAWYPGAQGATAIRDLIIGKINPSGKLSVSIPVSADTLPVYYNSFLPPPSGGYDTNSYVNAEKRVLYPFGYGLSYSSFEYKEISVKIRSKNLFDCYVTVENVSKIGGYETVQLYIRGRGNSVRRRNMELKGFKKVYLEPNSEKTVKFTLGYEELRVWSVNEKYELENGTVEIFAGSNPYLPLKTKIEIKI